MDRWRVIARIAPSATRNIVVRCTPTTVGDKVSSFAVTSDADNAGSVPTPSLDCRGVTPDISVDPTTLTYGAQLLTTTSAPQTFTVSNAGGGLSAPLDVNITKVGGASGNFNGTTVLSIGDPIFHKVRPFV